jgi:signal transduction histidine kinase
VNIRRRLSWIAISVVALVLASILALLYVRTQGHESNYFEKVALLRELKQLDARWELDVLRSRMGVESNYDSLVDPLVEFGQLQSELEQDLPNRLNGTNGEALVMLAGNFHQAIASKTRLIEHFKSHNSVLRNSMAFLPTAAADVQDAIANVPDSNGALKTLSADVAAILLASMEFSQASSDDKAAAINAGLDRLSQMSGTMPVRVREAAEIFASHVRTMLREQPVVDALLSSIAAVPTGVSIDALDNGLSGEQRATGAQAQVYRRYLLIFAAALMTLFLYVALNLIRSRSVINRINRDALATSQKRLEIATQGMHIGLWESDLVTGGVWCNDECYRIVGREPDGSLNTMAAWTALIHPDDKSNYELIVAAQKDKSGDEFGIHYRVRCKDDSYRWVMSQACATDRASDGVATRISGVRFDITELKEMEHQLASAQRLESIGQLAAGVAHEINTPIQYVNDSVYFIREGVQELLEYMRRAPPCAAAAPNSELTYLQDNLPQALDRAIEGLGRVSEIVRSMKEFSHPDQHEMAPIDLNRAIQSTLTVARNEYKYVATIVLELGELPPVVCFGSQINQVVLNLIVNAAHAIADRVKGTDETGVITLKTHQEGSDVLISVSDTGSGIPESIRDRVFEPFFTTKDVGRGTGQGLTMVRNCVVKSHHGTVSFQTAIGIGTTFFVRLPIESVACAEESRAA